MILTAKIEAICAMFAQSKISLKEQHVRKCVLKNLNILLGNGLSFAVKSFDRVHSLLVINICFVM